LRPGPPPSSIGRNFRGPRTPRTMPFPSRPERTKTPPTPIPPHPLHPLRVILRNTNPRSVICGAGMTWRIGKLCIFDRKNPIPMHQRFTIDDIGSHAAKREHPGHLRWKRVRRASPHQKTRSVGTSLRNGPADPPAHRRAGRTKRSAVTLRAGRHPRPCSSPHQKSRSACWCPSG